MDAASLMNTPELELRDIQGDVLLGMQKYAEQFVFFKIIDAPAFKALAREHLIGQVTTAFQVRERERQIDDRRRLREPQREAWLGLAVGFTTDGMSQLCKAQRPRMEAAFERGAESVETIASLNDPARAEWQEEFRSDRIDGVLLIAGPNAATVRHQGDTLRQRLGPAIKIVYSEMGTVRPGAQRAYEHFGFRDSISQPGIRGLTERSRPSDAPDQGLPGQDLLWPGEFVLGYPGQDPRDPRRPGPIAKLPAAWLKNGSYMVFRRLEQLVPEFRSFVAVQAGRLGMTPELLASRLFGRWPSGAPMELAPREDNPRLGGDERRNNDFGYTGDPFQRGCPYAAHIRKVNPRDDAPADKAETLTHRIMRAGIPFGPEVMPGEARTMHSRGLMFVCYQSSIERQFEFIQSGYSNNPDFIGGRTRPEDRSPLQPGFDPIIGQAPAGGARWMDEPASNYPTGNRRTRLEIPEQFVRLTAAGYFFMPSLAALRNKLLL